MQSDYVFEWWYFAIAIVVFVVGIYLHPKV